MLSTSSDAASVSSAGFSGFSLEGRATEISSPPPESPDLIGLVSVSPEAESLPPELQAAATKPSESAPSTARRFNAAVAVPLASCSTVTSRVIFVTVPFQPACGRFVVFFPG